MCYVMVSIIHGSGSWFADLVSPECCHSYYLHIHGMAVDHMRIVVYLAA